MNTEDLTKWVCIARTGTFADSSGQRHTFSESDLEAIRAGYDPTQSEAALVFGHPKDSDPAYGWVHTLKREGQKLFAQFARVPAAVKQLVDDGRYRYVSMSLSPDKKRLLHVGLLGAAAPAIDGLGPVAFGAEQVTINFSFPEGKSNGGSMNTEELQKQVVALMEKLAALQAECETLKTKLAESQNGKTEAEKQATAVAAEFAAYKGQIVTSQRQERVRALVKSGKLEPAKEAEVLSFAAALSEVKAPVNFAAPDGKAEQINAEERYFRELEAKEPAALSVNFASFATAPAHAGQPAKALPANVTSKL